MNQKYFQTICFVLIVLISGISFAFGEDLPAIQLPEPNKDIGKPLMQVLNDRKSTREFNEDKLSNQVLSNLLWAAFGINRPDSGKRTAPSAVNWQEVDIYVALAEGLYIYDAKNHMLMPILSEDIRAETGHQKFVKNAPVNLVYVADFSKISAKKVEDKILYSAADTGHISQNVYLFCASEGLGTVIRGLVDKEALAKIMKIGPDQRVILAQTVGYPKK